MNIPYAELVTNGFCSVSEEYLHSGKEDVNQIGLKYKNPSRELPCDAVRLNLVNQVGACTSVSYFPLPGMISTLDIKLPKQNCWLKHSHTITNTTGGKISEYDLFRLPASPPIIVLIKQVNKISIPCNILNIIISNPTLSYHHP